MMNINNKENDHNKINEIETSVKFKIKKHIFDSLKKHHISKCYINYFKDYRIINNEKKQIKNIVKITHNLIFFRGKFIPYKYTKAIEKTIDCISNFSEIETNIIRYIIYQQDNFRFAVEKISGRFGEAHHFSGEIEYPSYYREDLEKQMFDIMYEFLRPFWDQIEIETSRDDLTKIGSIPSRKFADLKLLKKDKMIIKAKFDGHKGRFINLKFKDDLNGMGNQKLMIFSFVKNLFFIFFI